MRVCNECVGHARVRGRGFVVFAEDEKTNTFC